MGYTGDGGPATAAQLTHPSDVAVDIRGNFYIVDKVNHSIRKVSASGIITTLAGGSTYGYSGDGGPSTASVLNAPIGITVDRSGNVYFSEFNNNCVRKVSTSGIITTYAGSYNSGYRGDGGPATAAWLYHPAGLTVDFNGNLYIADRYNHCVRKVAPSGIITTFAGTNSSGYTGDGGPATAAELMEPYGLTVDRHGNVYISDRSAERIRKVSTSGIITTIAGDGFAGLPGDGGMATDATLSYPMGIAVDSNDNLYIVEAGGPRIRKVSPSGIISHFAGSDRRLSGFGGDGAVSSAALFNAPYGVALDSVGNMYVADNGNHRIRRISNCHFPDMMAISGPNLVTVGNTITLTDTIAGGTWSSSNTALATVNASGAVRGVAVGTVIISYSKTNTCGTSHVTKSINVRLATSVLGFGNSEEIVVYPEPTTGALNMELPMHNGSFLLYDVFGHLMLQQEVISNHYQLDLSNYPKGIYMLVVVSEGDKWVHRVILQ